MRKTTAFTICMLGVGTTLTLTALAAEFGPWFKAMDSNSDGRITLEEYMAHQKTIAEKKGSRWTPELSRKQFIDRDANKDGAITPDETSPATRLSQSRMPGDSEEPIFHGDPKQYFGRCKTFTAVDGRTSRARILSYNDQTKTVNLQREKGWNCIVDISALCPEDQDYVLEWNSCKQFGSRRMFKIATDLRNEQYLEKKTTEPKVIIRQNRFEVSFNNRSMETIDGVSLEYCIYYTQDYIKNGQQMHGNGVCYGKQEIGTIAPRTDKTVLTKEVMTSSEVWSYDAGDRESNVQEGSIVGIRFRIIKNLKSGGTIVREDCWPENIDKKMKWVNHSIDAGRSFRITQLLKNRS